MRNCLLIHGISESTSYDQFENAVTDVCQKIAVSKNGLKFSINILCCHKIGTTQKKKPPYNY